MQKKAYAAQSKNVLLSMLADDSQIIRNKVIHIINKWRNGSQYGNKCVTTCIVLEIELLGKNHMNLSIRIWKSFMNLNEIQQLTNFLSTIILVTQICN